MREEYDFSNAVRGRHAERYAEGVAVKILEEPTTTDPSDVVRLDPDVKAAFPNSHAVNEGLRRLMKMRKAS